MKILLISDVHANYDALKALDDAVGEVDLTVFAGDFLDWGFYPNETLDWFRRRKHIAVLGNHDEGLIGMFRNPSFFVPDAPPSFAEYILGTITAENFICLTQYPTAVSFEADGIPYYMSHTFGAGFIEKLFSGRAGDLFESIWEQAGLPCAPQRRILFGHSHMCSIFDVGEGRCFLNPGSLSYRKGEDHIRFGGEYMLIENTAVTTGYIRFPAGEIRRRIEASTFTDGVKRDAMRCICQGEEQEV